MKGTSLEAQSTEEVLRSIEEANIKLRNEKVETVALGSMDVKALYPSLRIKAAAKVVAEEIMKAEIDYQGVDYNAAGSYLATVLPKERHTKEGVAGLLP